MLLTRNFPELWKFGHQERADRGTPIVLRGAVVAAIGVARFTTLTQIAPGGAYSVAAGKTLYITRVLYWASATLAVWALRSGTTDVGNNSAADMAGGVGIDSGNGSDGNVLVATTANVLYDVDYFFSVAAGRFVGISHAQASDTLRVLLQGFEA